MIIKRNLKSQMPSLKWVKLGDPVGEKDECPYGRKKKKTNSYYPLNLLEDVATGVILVGLPEFQRRVSLLCGASKFCVPLVNLNRTLKMMSFRRRRTRFNGHLWFRLQGEEFGFYLRASTTLLLITQLGGKRGRNKDLRALFVLVRTPRWSCLKRFPWQRSTMASLRGQRAWH
ncbi:hypothetical protein RJT34_16327 [Clitoria ternatea]|uniref:Uncharacterized protein n=1 Tax=Clitoria ternatea TaxID=43366 RepID=A0AAN9J8H9_CLITE